MAISDLLWACPTCGEDRGLQNPDCLCSACGTRFLRGPAATIRAVDPGGVETTRSAAEWIERLPGLETLLDADPIRAANVRIRAVTGDKAVYGEAGYLNRAELFGDPEPGLLTLRKDRLVVARGGSGEEPGNEPGEASPEEWPLEALTAVQASSSSLQVKRAGKALVSFRFPDDAIYLWENLLREAVRVFYRESGRGEILEFQPRIVTRPITPASA